MKLEDVFRRLSLGVLSNLSIGNEGQGSIAVQNHARLAMMVDNALGELYARFNLLEREMLIRVYDTVTEYPFEKKYAFMDSTVGTKFIEDSASNTFTEDVLKVLQIFNEYGEEITLNDPGDPTSLFTPSEKLLLVPYPVTDECYHVLYQAYHPKISSNVPVSLEDNILLPSVLMLALEHHIAYQVMSPMNGAEHTAKAAEHLARYEMICVENESRDTTSTSLVQTHSKLEDRGFV